MMENLFAALSPFLADESLVCGRSGDDSWPGDASWEAFLCALPAADVEACEQNGLHRLHRVSSQSPETLRALCSAVATAAATLGVGESSGSSSCSCSHHAWRQSAEKSSQVSALLAAAGAKCDLRRVRRVVDVGCGKGFFSGLGLTLAHCCSPLLTAAAAPC